MASCPIKLPGLRERTTFSAHGNEVQVKQIKRGDYFLARAVSSPPRSRWGTRSQICEDIRHVLETGSLPEPRGGF